MRRCHCGNQKQLGNRDRAREECQTLAKIDQGLADRLEALMDGE